MQKNESKSSGTILPIDRQGPNKSWVPAANSGWSFNGPDFQALVIDPTNNLILYATSINGGIIKTTDGGNTWIAKNNGIPSYVNSGYQAITSIAINPDRNQIIYAGTRDGGVVKSSNGGDTWQVVKSPTDEWRNTTTSLVIDPTNTQTVYAGTEYGDVFKSTDGGITWKSINFGIANVGIMTMSVNPLNSNVIYTGSDIGDLFRTDNGGMSWTKSTASLPMTPRTIAIDTTNDTTAYVGTWGSGIYKTNNGGISWTAENNGLPGHDLWISSVAIDNNKTQTLYAALSSWGIYKSLDGGSSWTSSNGNTTIKNASAIIVDPTSSQTIYAATDAGILKSTDGGSTWVTPVTNVSGFVWCLVMDPNNNQTIYAGTGLSVYKSVDGGNNWAANNEIFQKYGYQNIMSIAIDPLNSNVVHAGSGGGGGQLFQSIDGGVTWTPQSSGMMGSDIRNVIVDPKNGLLIVATYDNGILKELSSGAPTISAPATATCTIGVYCEFKVSATGWPIPVLGVSGTLPTGLSFDSVTGILSGTPLLGSANNYQLMFAASTGVPPDASRSIALTVLPASVLNVTISKPSDISNLPSLTAISGSAGGNGLSKVELQISDGIYYLQSNGSFSTIPAWLAATGTGNWSLDTTNAAWVEGITYSIIAKATSSTSMKVSSTSFRILQSVVKQHTEISATFTPNAIRTGDSTYISGALTKTDKTALVGQPVTVIITPPSTKAIPFPVPVITTYTTDTSGSFKSTDFLYPTPGVYAVQVRFNGNNTLQPAVYNLSLPVVAQSGYAIIVVGKASDSSLLDLHAATATKLYDTLITKRGFLDGNITPLVSTADRAVTKQEIQSAINQMKLKYEASPAPFYLIMIDHGNPTGFMLGGSTPALTLTPAELSPWLDDFENGSSSDALDANPRFLIVGTCYSGLFQSLAKQGRIVITSSGSTESSLAGAISYEGATTSLSGGDYFIDNLFAYLGRGDHFNSAYTHAASDVALRDPRTVPLALHNGVVDTLAQHPLLNDTGNATASYELANSTVGTVTSSLSLGEGIRVPTSGSPADITGVTPTTLPPLTTATATLRLTVNDNSRVGRAWVEVRTPDTTVPPSNGGTGQVIPGNLDSMPLIYDGNKWIGDYDKFTTPGRYDIYYYTRDIQTDDISPVAHSVVYRQKDNNTAPGSFSLILPEDQATTAPMFPLVWLESLDSDGLTYTLQVATDQNFTNIIYKQENLPQAVTYMPKDALKNPATNQYYCQNGISYCHWKITAVDTFGSTTGSDTRSFTITQTNSLPSLLYGSVRNSATGALITTATVQLGTAPAEPVMPNGYYLLMPDATGTAKTLKISATGYTGTSISATLTPGAVYENNILLTQGSNVPGDCDNSGTVTIAEVQSAVNMFLGLSAPAACVDTDGVGGVTIAEVQKVINSFLGL